MNELAHTVEIVARFAGDLLQLRQRLAVGLVLSPHIHFAESKQRGLVRVRFFVVRILLLVSALPDDRRKNGDPLLAFVDETAKLVPCVHPGYARC